MFISENHVYYGSPGVSDSSYLLTGYAGLPFVLTNYRLRFSIVIRKLLMLGQLPETTKGIYFCYSHGFINIFRCQTLSESDFC